MTDTRFPNETLDYRRARNELLEAEAELREQVARVAALRRQMPLGGEVKEDYVFDEVRSDGQQVQTRLSQLFAPETDSLFVYSYMFAPEAVAPCPLCTAMLDGLDGNADHISQQINLAVVARAPAQRLADFATGRGWRNLRLLSSAGNSFQADYKAEDDQGQQWPMANVFTRREGKIHHFWASELLFRRFEGGDPRHVDMIWPLWNVLDLTSHGRGETWYPSLAYD